VFQRITHAVQHLKFNGIGRQSALLCPCDHRSNAANIMGCNRQAHLRVLVQQQIGHVLEVCISVAFPGINGR
jgi:hypothetical protein